MTNTNNDYIFSYFLVKSQLNFTNRVLCQWKCSYLILFKEFRTCISPTYTTWHIDYFELKTLEKTADARTLWLSFFNFKSGDEILTEGQYTLYQKAYDILITNWELELERILYKQILIKWFFTCLQLIKYLITFLFLFNFLCLFSPV